MTDPQAASEVPRPDPEVAQVDPEVPQAAPLRLQDLVGADVVAEMLASLPGPRAVLVDRAGDIIAGGLWTAEAATEYPSAYRDLGLQMAAALRDAVDVGPLTLSSDLPPHSITGAVVRLRHEILGGVFVGPADGAAPRFASAYAKLIERWAQASYELQNTVAELVWRYEELSVLYDGAETIVSVMDLDEVSRRILEKARDMLDVDNASLMLLDTDTNTLRIQDAIGLEREVMENIRLRVGEEISGWVAREGRPLLVEDIERHEVFGKRNKERYINRSLLSVPLKIKDRVIGVLNVNNKKNGTVFTSGDMKMLSALASMAAISIENAHTYSKAITDRLTRLYNYGYFREELHRRIAQAQEEESVVSLLMFDIDHFKNFNDKNGHELANVALVRVSNICLESSRQKGDRIPDVVARYGGEEFMILLYGVPREAAYAMAERIRKRVYDTDFQGGENQPNGRLSISMGVSTWPHDANDGDELVNAADKALYRAKKAGRNNVQQADGRVEQAEAASAGLIQGESPSAPPGPPRDASGAGKH